MPKSLLSIAGRVLLGIVLSVVSFSLMNADALGQEIELTLSTEIIGTSDLGTTHRVYVERTAGADGFRIVSMFGGGAAEDSFAPNAELSVTSSTNFYQHPQGGVTAAQVEDVLFEIFPDLTYDSWFTIGDAMGNDNAMSQIGSPVWNAAALTFEGGGDFLVNDDFGGAFYLLSGDAEQGQSEDGRVLIGQFTSTGEVQIQANVQWLSNGEDDTDLMWGLATTLLPEVTGCTNELAVNYMPDAVWDDGSCLDVSLGLIWEQVALSPESAAPDGAPTYRVWVQFENPEDTLIAVFGTQEDPIFVGSSDGFFQHENGAALAPNVNNDLLGILPTLAADSWLAIETDVDDAISTTVYASGLSLGSFEAGGSLESDPDFGGSWYVLPSALPPAVDAQGRVLIAQLTTSGQIEFNVNINYRTADGPAAAIALSLIFPEAGGSLGCGDVEACNYDSEVSPGGLCEYLDALGLCGGSCAGDSDGDGVCDSEELAGCTDIAFDNFNPAATDDDGSCANVEFGVQLDSLVYEWVAGSNAETSDLGLTSFNTYRIYAQFDGPGASVSSIFGDASHPFHLSCEGQFYQAPGAGPLANSAPYDSWWALSTSADPVEPNSVGIDFDGFESGGDLLVDEAFGGAIFLIPGDDPEAVSGADGRVLLGQFSTDAISELTLNLHFSTATEQGQDALDLTLTFPSVWSGCMDELACNFNVAGAETCTFALPAMDCNGVCIVDTDGDGVCDENEISGCMYANACNYNELATDEDSSCTFAEPHLDCLGNCLNDSNENDICDHSEHWGCTYESAENFDSGATIDDSSCFLPPCTELTINCKSDIDDDGYVAMNDLLIFLSVFTNECQ